MFAASVRYRHVVFADAARKPRRPVDLAPRFLIPLKATPCCESGFCEQEESFLRWLLSRAGLKLETYRMETLRRRLSACLRMLHCDGIDEARLLLHRNVHMIPVAISALVIGVSSFFRDAAVFDRLRDQVLPELCGRGKPLRIWSAGCSEGQELYSIAMLLAERRVLHACQLLGTDCRADAITRMIDGIYDATAARQLPDGMLRKYFERHSAGWRISTRIRSAVRCRVGNVLSEPESGPWDMISCRNLGIYLEPDVAAALWRVLEERLRPGGYLVLGKAERPSAVKSLAYVGPCLYRKIDSDGQNS